MSSESVCQVACSWVEVCTFHTRLFGVMYVTCGDFHDGLEKGTASVHQILCQSWEKCFGDPHIDSTILLGPKLESCAGVSTACPVQDRSYISWWWTHRETHKLHNSWNCYTNSTARPSGLMSDQSRHCWGGGNWLWDMPMGSEGRIGHAPCRSQICVQDADSWPEAAAHQCLHWTSSARLQWWNLVQGHHWWWELGLRLRPWDKATILPVENPMSPRPKKARQVKSNVKSMIITFFDVKGSVHKEFVPKGQTVNSRFYCDILRRLRENVRRCRPKLWREQTWLFHHDNSLSYTSVLTQQFLAKNKIFVIPPSTLLPWFGTLWLLPISKNEIEAERTPVWYHWGDTDWITESAWHW